MKRPGLNPSIFVRKNIADLDLQLVQHGFELVEGEVMLALFDAIKGHRCQSSFLGELGIRKLTPGFAQVFRELTVEAFSHPEKVAKETYRM